MCEADSKPPYRLRCPPATFRVWCQTAEGESGEEMRQIFCYVLAASILGGCSQTAASTVEAETPATEVATYDLKTSFSGDCSTYGNQKFAEVIAFQIEDLRALNFEKAYLWAAPEFRNSNSLEVFTTVIELNYSILLVARSAYFSDCITSEDLWGEALVTVQSSEGQLRTYNYRMLNSQEEGWRVFGVYEEPETRSLS